MRTGEISNEKNRTSFSTTMYCHAY